MLRWLILLTTHQGQQYEVYFGFQASRLLVVVTCVLESIPPQMPVVSEASWTFSALDGFTTRVADLVNLYAVYFHTGLVLALLIAHRAHCLLLVHPLKHGVITLIIFMIFKVVATVREDSVQLLLSCTVE